MCLRQYDKIVLLGAGGSIGKALYDYFTKEKLEVIGISRRPGPSIQYVLDLSRAASYEEINSLITKNTLVLFLAGQSSKQSSFMHWTVNTNLWEVCLSNINSTARLIFFSSVDTILDDEFPIETTSLFWAHYGYSKAQSEKLARKHNIDVLRVYPFFHNNNRDMLKRSLRIPIIKIGLKVTPDVLIEYDDVHNLIMALSELSGTRNLNPKKISQNELCKSLTFFTIPVSRHIFKALIAIIILFHDRNLRPYFRDYLQRKLGF